jgi:hypothetical protein
MLAFHFKNSLRPFFMITAKRNNTIQFLDVEYGVYYRYKDELKEEELEFYTKKDDPDFEGVAIIGELTY